MRKKVAFFPFLHILWVFGQEGRAKMALFNLAAKRKTPMKQIIPGCQTAKWIFNVYKCIIRIGEMLHKNNNNLVCTHLYY